MRSSAVAGGISDLRHRVPESSLKQPAHIPASGGGGGGEARTIPVPRRAVISTVTSSAPASEPDLGRVSDSDHLTSGGFGLTSDTSQNRARKYVTNYVALELAGVQWSALELPYHIMHIRFHHVIEVGAREYLHIFQGYFHLKINYALCVIGRSCHHANSPIPTLRFTRS